MLSCYRLKIHAGFVYSGQFVCLLYMKVQLAIREVFEFKAKTSEVWIGANDTRLPFLPKLKAFKNILHKTFSSFN